MRPHDDAERTGHARDAVHRAPVPGAGVLPAVSATRHSGGWSPGALVALQRTVGNTAVAGMMAVQRHGDGVDGQHSTPAVQRALTDAAPAERSLHNLAKRWKTKTFFTRSSGRSRELQQVDRALSGWRQAYEADPGTPHRDRLVAVRDAIDAWRTAKGEGSQAGGRADYVNDLDQHVAQALGRTASPEPAHGSAPESVPESAVVEPVPQEPASPERAPEEPATEAAVPDQAASVASTGGSPMVAELLAVAKGVTSAGGTTFAGGDEADLFQGDDANQRQRTMRAFRTAVERAEKIEGTAERAAHLAADIKSSQYLRDGNTRTSTAAVFAVYKAAGQRLDASPLQVFAAIGQNEQQAFDLAGWLRGHESEGGTGDTEASVPGLEDLEGISRQAGVLATAHEQLMRVLGQWRAYKERHLTEEEARHQHEANRRANPSLTQSFEDAWEDAEFPTAEDRLEDFKLGLSVEDELVWDGEETVREGYRLITPGGGQNFAGTVQWQVPDDDDFDIVEEVEALLEQHKAARAGGA